MSSISPDVGRLLDKNKIYQKTFKPPFSIAQFSAMMIENPTLSPPRICIITCCDPRVVPEYIFGLELGDAIVMRTAGGSIAPAIPGLLAIDSLAAIKDIIVMRHTDCGTAYWTDQTVKKTLQERCGHERSDLAKNMSEMNFCPSNGDRGDEELLRRDVEWLRTSPLFRDQYKDRISGMIYQTSTGAVDVVC